MFIQKINIDYPKCKELFPLVTSCEWGFIHDTPEIKTKNHHLEYVVLTPPKEKVEK